MLGLKGLVVKTHGNATAKEVKNTLFQCLTFKEQHIAEKFRELYQNDGTGAKEDGTQEQTTKKAAEKTEDKQD